MGTGSIPLALICGLAGAITNFYLYGAFWARAGGLSKGGGTWKESRKSRNPMAQDRLFPDRLGGRADYLFLYPILLWPSQHSLLTAFGPLLTSWGFP